MNLYYAYEYVTMKELVPNWWGYDRFESKKGAIIAFFYVIMLVGCDNMNEYMKIANELAEDNLKTNVGGPFGACIVKDGKIIGRGSNHVLANNDPTAHAEVMAIRDACHNINSYDLSGCELYTSCFPCPMCMSAIIWSNINKVYYGNTKEDAEKIGFRDRYIYEALGKIKNNEETIIDLKCINREETIKAFNTYMEKQDKTIY